MARSSLDLAAAGYGMDPSVYDGVELSAAAGARALGLSTIWKLNASFFPRFQALLEEDPLLAAVLRFYHTSTDKSVDYSRFGLGGDFGHDIKIHRGQPKDYDGDSSDEELDRTLTGSPSWGRE